MCLRRKPLAISETIHLEGFYIEKGDRPARRRKMMKRFARRAFAWTILCITAPFWVIETLWATWQPFTKIMAKFDCGEWLD